MSSNHRLPSSIRMLTILSQYSLVEEVVSLSYNCCCCHCFSVLRTQGNRAEDSAIVPPMLHLFYSLHLSLSLQKKTKTKEGAGERKRELSFFRVFYFFPYPAFARFFLSVKSRRDCTRALRRGELFCQLLIHIRMPFVCLSIS